MKKWLWKITIIGVLGMCGCGQVSKDTTVLEEVPQIEETNRIENVASVEEKQEEVEAEVQGGPLTTNPVSYSGTEEEPTYTYMAGNGEVISQGDSDFSYAALSNLEFFFCSGAGGWWTELYIHEDGTFEGLYVDGEMGSYTESYPKGKMYYSEFCGSFTEPVRVDDYTYVFQMDTLEYPKGFGSEIIDGVLYEYDTAYGIEGGENFYIYLPGKAYQELPEEFRSWVNDYYRWAWNGEPEEENATLPFYGLFNVEKGYGFYSYEKE